MGELAGPLLSFGAMLVLGIAWFLAARAAKDMQALASMFFFQAAGLPFFLLLLPFGPISFDTRSLLSLLALGIYETAMMFLIFYALRVGVVSVVTPIIDTYGAVTAMLGILLLGESVSLVKLSAIFILVIGIFLLSLKRVKSGSTFSLLLPGALPALGVAVGNGIYFLLVTILVRQTSWFVTALVIRLAISATAWVVLAIRRTNWRTLLRSVSWKWILPGAFLDVVGFSLYNAAVLVSETSYTTVIISTMSLIIILLSYIFLKERLTGRQWAGVAGIITGLVLLNLA